MSSTPVLGFIKDITAKKVKAVEDRLKKEKPNQKYTDPAQQGWVYTLLHKAVAVGSPEIVAALLKAGADVNAKDSRGATPLHWLASCNSDAHLKIAELLLKQKGTDIQALNDAKATPLHEAAANANSKLLKVLLAKGAKPADTSPGYSPLHAACQSCHGWQTCLPVVEQLLQAAPELLMQQDSCGFTPLMRLLQHSLWTDAKQLLTKGDCCVNAKGQAGVTALLLACSCPAPDMQLVSDLLAAGASAAVQDSPAGNTPLLLAAKLGGPAGLNLAQLLLQQNSRLTSSAAGTGAAAVAQVHADKCNINAANAAGETALSLVAAAAAGGGGGQDSALQLLGLVLAQQPAVAEQVAASLLQRGLTAQLPDALTAQLVALLPADAVAKVAAAVLPQQQQPVSFTSLLGMKLYRTAAAHLVKTSGKEPGAVQDAAGNTHLHNAVSGPDDLPDLVTALLAVWLSPDAANQDGDTPLHIAARAGHVGACRALVAGGADVLKRNNKNRVPGNQLKLPEATKAFLAEAEEAARMAKDDMKHSLWDDKMKATQTQSAFGIRVT